MPTERLSDEQIARTAAYLAEVRERYGANAVVHVQSLFGRCCLATLQRNPAWGALAAEAAGLAEDLVRQAPRDLDPLPLIEVGRMMKESGGRTVGPLEQLLRRIAPELESQPLEIRSIGRVRHIASLLSQLGFPMATARPSKDAASLLADEASWATAPAVRLSEMADHLAADRSGLDETATRLLVLIALGELRNYRLDVGCKLLRTVLQLGVPCAEAQDGVDFIALQRRRDGRYGFVDRLSEKPAAIADPDLTLFLPLTLNAVWLFAIEAAGRTASAPALIGGAA